jgi:hypothetical protein
MTFPDAFAKHVVPLIHRALRAQGLFIALEMSTWADAYAEIWRIANQRGAAHLPDATHDLLDTFILVGLSEAIEMAQPAVARAVEAADRVHADVTRGGHYAR